MQREAQRLVDDILEAHGNEQSKLLAVLQDIQDELNYLPREALERVAEKMKVPMSRIAGMATFFAAFSLEPRGRHICQVCTGTACYARGAERLVDELERELDVCVGETSSDEEFTLETVNCVGACALGPLVKVDEKYHGHMNSSKISKMLKKYRKES